MYFFPPCFQQLRADVRCLPQKIADGRAFWGCALVLWCLSCPNADVVVVEQPDTIVYDSLPPLPGVDIIEFRTTQYGDVADKFIRLSVRNATIPPFLVSSATPVPQPNRSQFDFASADERDRIRSSWVPYTRTCAALARLAPKLGAPQPLPYAWLISVFALVWQRAGNPLPADYDAADARPATQELRDYQSRRGPSDRPADRHHPNRESSTRSVDERAPATARCDGGRLPDSEESGLVSLQSTAPPGHCVAALIVICMLMHPLVLLHANGFVVTGTYVPSEVKPAAMRSAQALCHRLFNSVYSVFMVGQYANGVKVFTAPVDFLPRRAAIARSAAGWRCSLKGQRLSGAP